MTSLTAWNTSATLIYYTPSCLPSPPSGFPSSDALCRCPPGVCASHCCKPCCTASANLRAPGPSSSQKFLGSRRLERGPRPRAREEGTRPDATEARSPSGDRSSPGANPGAGGDSRNPAYSLRKSLSWRRSISCSSAKLRRPQPSGARGSRPRGGEDMLRSLRRAERRAGGSLGGRRGWRRIRGRRRLGGAGGGRHFPGRAGFFESNRALLKRRKQTQTQRRGGPWARGGAEVTYDVRA